jgi:hypothetical protein
MRFPTALALAVKTPRYYLQNSNNTRKGKLFMSESTKAQSINPVHASSLDRYPHFKNQVEGFDVRDGFVGLNINIDSSYHVYLRDHVFGKDSFVPATMIIELLFEAALFYCEYHLKIEVKDLKPAGLADFSILRALAMPPGDSLKIEFIFKQVIQNDREILLDIDIISKRVNKANQVLGTRVNVNSTVALSSNITPAPDYKIPAGNYTYYRIPKSLFYEYYFPSLGPCFQSSCAQFAVSDNRSCFIGEYDCLGKEKNFILGQDSVFVTSPLGNDSCLQFAVFFSRIINLIGRLPIGGKKLEFYRRHPAEGKVKVVVERITIDDDMLCNINSFDSDGLIFHAAEFVVKKSPYHTLMDREKFDTIMNKYITQPLNW